MTNTVNVVGFEGVYEIDENGNVVRVAAAFRHPVTRKPLVPTLDRATGYYKVRLSDGARRVTRPIHVLVCEAFNGPRPAGMDVRHLDGNKANNSRSNLAWGTRTENNLDKREHGTSGRKSVCKHGHELNASNVYVRANSLNCRPAATPENQTKEGNIMGDIGLPVRHIELEPVETPMSVPVTTPDRESVPA